MTVRGKLDKRRDKEKEGKWDKGKAIREETSGVKVREMAGGGGKVRMNIRNIL